MAGPSSVFEDKRPFADILFDIVMMLCERFPACSPFAIRRERAREVFEIVVRFTRHAAHEKKHKKTVNGKQIIRKPAGDHWF